MSSDTGELITVASLDRETKEVFTIKGNRVKYLRVPVKWGVRMVVVLLSALPFFMLSGLDGSGKIFRYRRARPFCIEQITLLFCYY